MAKPEIKFAVVLSNTQKVRLTKSLFRQVREGCPFDRNWLNWQSKPTVRRENHNLAVAAMRQAQILGTVCYSWPRCVRTVYLWDFEEGHLCPCCYSYADEDPIDDHVLWCTPAGELRRFLMDGQVWAKLQMPRPPQLYLGSFLFG